MAVCRELAINRMAQVEHINNRGRAQVEFFHHDFTQGIIGDDACAESIHHNGNRLGDTDGICQLDFTLPGEACRHNILGHITRRIGRGAVHLRRVLAGEAAAAYAARWIAKNIVAAGLASKCQVQLAYAIGVAHPVSVLVETFGTGTVADTKLEEAVEKVFDLRPTAIIRDLDLRRPIYRQLAAYGHMGREELGVAWEKCDRVEALRAAL